MEESRDKTFVRTYLAYIHNELDIMCLFEYGGSPTGHSACAGVVEEGNP